MIHYQGNVFDIQISQKMLKVVFDSINKELNRSHNKVIYCIWVVNI